MAHQTRAQRAKAATRTLPEEDPEFQIAPMIDILLVLLVFFMSIATEQVLQVNKEVQLPVAKDAAELSPEEKNKSELMINLLWLDLGDKGSIIVDDKTIEPSVLQDMIRKKKEINADLRVIIRTTRGPVRSPPRTRCCSTRVLERTVSRTWPTSTTPPFPPPGPVCSRRVMT